MGRHRLLSDEEILRRARAVFVERGYAARTRDIADAIGMSWPALVLRFGGKWELFRCAMVEPIRARATFPAAAQGAELRDLLERLHALLSEQWPMRLQYRLAALSSAHDDTEELLERLRPAFEVQAQRGTIRSDIAAGALARLVLSLLVGDVAQRFVRLRCRARGRALAARRDRRPVDAGSSDAGDRTSRSDGGRVPRVARIVRHNSELAS